MSQRPLTPTRPAPGARPVGRAAAVTGLAALALSGCTALSGGYVAPVVVTVTPTVTVTPKAPAVKPTPSAASSTTALPDLPSDDTGKKFDLGHITDVTEDQGIKIIVLDRVTSRSIPSATVFASGITLEPHTREIFREGASQTYRIPVAPTATFTKMTCTAMGQPAQSAPSTLDELAGLSGRESVVQVQLDDKGWATSVTSDPVCR